MQLDRQSDMQTTKHSNMHTKSQGAKLFYIVGASGSGKDSLIRQFRKVAMENSLPIVSSHRYITRADTNDESSVHLSEREFELRDQSDFFSMSWRANGLCYGIGREIEHWMDSGFSVLVNGSRAYLPEAQQKYGRQLYSVLIDVPDALLEKRLQSRGREDQRNIEQRLQRHRELLGTIDCDGIVYNHGALDSAAAAMYEVISNAMMPDEAWRKTRG